MVECVVDEALTNLRTGERKYASFSRVHDFEIVPQVGDYFENDAGGFGGFASYLVRVERIKRIIPLLGHHWIFIPAINHGVIFDKRKMEYITATDPSNIPQTLTDTNKLSYMMGVVKEAHENSDMFSHSSRSGKKAIVRIVDEQGNLFLKDINLLGKNIPLVEIKGRLIDSIDRGFRSEAMCFGDYIAVCLEDVIHTFAGSQGTERNYNPIIVARILER